MGVNYRLKDDEVVEFDYEGSFRSPSSNKLYMLGRCVGTNKGIYYFRPDAKKAMLIIGLLVVLVGLPIFLSSFAFGILGLLIGPFLMALAVGLPAVLLLALTKSKQGVKNGVGSGMAWSLGWADVAEVNAASERNGISVQARKGENGLLYSKSRDFLLADIRKVLAKAANAPVGLLLVCLLGLTGCGAGGYQAMPSVQEAKAAISKTLKCDWYTGALDSGAHWYCLPKAAAEESWVKERLTEYGDVLTVALAIINRASDSASTKVDEAVAKPDFITLRRIKIDQGQLLGILEMFGFSEKDFERVAGSNEQVVRNELKIFRRGNDNILIFPR